MHITLRAVCGRPAEHCPALHHLQCLQLRQNQLVLQQVAGTHKGVRKRARFHNGRHLLHLGLRHEPAVVLASPGDGPGQGFEHTHEQLFVLEILVAGDNQAAQVGVHSDTLRKRQQKRPRPQQAAG